MYVKHQIKAPPWLLVVLLTASGASITNAQAKFFGLGHFADGTNSEVYGLSADGSTVVGSSPSASGSSRLSRWTLGTGWVQLDGLPGEQSSVALGASGNGSFVVGLSVQATGQSAVRWSSDSGTMDLGTLPGGTRPAYAYATSEDGKIVVGFGSTNVAREAFRWTESQGMVGLGYLETDNRSEAFGMSQNGSVVVGRSSKSNSPTSYEAFRWTAEFGMVGLGQLQSDGFNSQANGVSGDGNVIIGSARRPGVHNEAFRWTSDGGMVGIGDLPGATHSSRMFDTNYDGSILVGDGSDSTGIVAAMWDERHGIRSISSFAEGDLGLDLGGWTLNTAFGISDDGKYIAGIGRNPEGDIEGWMLLVPEPSMSLFFLTSFAVCTFRRRRKIPTFN